MNNELSAYRKEQLANLNDTIATTLNAYWRNAELLADDLANDDEQHEDLLHNVEELVAVLKMSQRNNLPSFLR